MNILIIEDSPSMYLLIEKLAQMIDHECVWAKTTAEAVTILNDSSHFELILLDWILPDEMGIDFLKRNRKEEITNIPIIMISVEHTPRSNQ